MRGVGIAVLFVASLAALCFSVCRHFEWNPAIAPVITAFAIALAMSAFHALSESRVESIVASFAACGAAPFLGYAESFITDIDDQGNRFAMSILFLGIGLAVTTFVAPAISRIKDPFVLAVATNISLGIVAIIALVDMVVGSLGTAYPLLASIGVAGYLVSVGYRKYRAFETYASRGTEGMHLGAGRIQLGDEIVQITHAAALEKGPVLVWRTDIVKEGGYRDGKKLDTRVIEGTREDVRHEATEDRNARNALAIAWLVLVGAPAAASVWFQRF